MSAALIWIFLPGFIGAVLFFFRKMERLTAILGTATALLLAALAWQVSIGTVYHLGPISFQINESLQFLGRRFVLQESDRSTLAIIYLIAAFWFGGAYISKAGRMLIPMGLGVVGLMIAAIAVEPFLYAALIIEMAALLCIPILVAPGKRAGKGVFRFLTFQSFGTPFILLTGLFTGWLAAPSNGGTPQAELTFRAVIFLSLGFAFLLGIFPFHSWIPMLAEEAHPYATAFVFFMLPGMVSLFGLGFIAHYDWLRFNSLIFDFLRYGGTIMVVFGGIWAALQRHLGRILGYAVMVDTGLTLLAISVQPPEAFLALASSGLGATFFALFFTRALALGTWAMALAVIQAKTKSLSFQACSGAARSLPAASLALVFASFSLAGFPIFAGFPVRLSIWTQLGSQNPALAFGALLGAAGLIVGGLRTMTVLVGSQAGIGSAAHANLQPDTPPGTQSDMKTNPQVKTPTSKPTRIWQLTESGPLLFFLTSAVAALLLFGLFPAW